MCGVEDNDKMDILNRNTLHNRRRCFKFSNTTILYIILITIQISFCSARPNQNNTMRQQIEERDSGVIKATEELPPSAKTEIYTNENDDTEDEEEEDVCDDGFDDKCNEYTELLDLNHPNNSFTELKNGIETSTATTPMEHEPTTMQPESTTTEPESTTTEPESTTMQPESTTTEPESTTMQPESTTTEPESTTEYQTSIDELHNDTITSTTAAPPVINEEVQLDSFTSTTEKSHFSNVLTTTSNGSDHNNGINFERANSKGSILTNCSFILFTILFFYRHFVN